MYFVYSIYSSFPTQKERDQRIADGMSDYELRKLEQEEDDELAREEQWMRDRGLMSPGPMSPMPRTPGIRLDPMTPRTTAFNKLSGNRAPPPTTDGKSSGNTSATSPNSLPFREQYGSQEPSHAK